MIVKEIKSTAKKFKPSENILPVELLIDKINQYKNNEHIPISNDLKKLDQIYELSHTLTVINGTNILSYTKIPLIDYTLEYNQVFPKLMDYELKEIENLRKISHMSMDLFLCSKTDKNIRIMSKSNLKKCQKSFDNSIIICEGRKMKQHLDDYSKPCQKLPENLIVEVKTDKIFVKTSQKSISVICDKFNEEISLNSTYSILDVKPGCKLMGKDFFLDKIHDAFSTNFTSNPITKMKLNIESLNPPTNENLLKNEIEKIKSHHLNYSKLHDDMSSLKKQDKDNRISIKEMNDSFEDHAKVNWISISFGSTFILLLVILCCYKFINILSNRCMSYSME